MRRGRVREEGKGGRMKEEGRRGRVRRGRRGRRGKMRKEGEKNVTKKLQRKIELHDIILAHISHNTLTAE